MVGGPKRDVVVVQPEVDLIAGFDAELVAELLGNDDLALRSHTASHTNKYNFRCDCAFRAATRSCAAGSAGHGAVTPEVDRSARGVGLSPPAASQQPTRISGMPAIIVAEIVSSSRMTPRASATTGLT